MRLFLLFCAGILIHIPGLRAQSSFIFDDTSLPQVHITLDQTYLESIFAPGNENSDEEFPAHFEFRRGDRVETADSVGFRLRGNTSRHSAKKSFKVSFNTFKSGRQFFGLDKMNLNGEHNDPSIIRSKLSWDLFREADVPAPRAAHVQVYINGEYYGLYINVEHIDDEFIQDRFGSGAGNLYKCLYPADLAYRGTLPENYKHNVPWGEDRRVYELKTNKEADDYTDLASLIRFLETSSDTRFENEIRNYLNVDGVLRWMAVDILTGNWDNYWFNQNNYYLYNNPGKNRFEFIPYDYDNTFGIDWMGPDWGIRDINNWGPGDQGWSPDRKQRPLTERILGIDEFRDRLNFYVKQFGEAYFTPEHIQERVTRLRTMTDSAAQADDYRTYDYGYTWQDYLDSFEKPLGGHVEYGLMPYVETRQSTAMQQLLPVNITPIIRSVQSGLVRQENRQLIRVEAEVLDEDVPQVSAFFNTGSLAEVALMDDGNGADLSAGDGIYSAFFDPGSYTGEIAYHLEATDERLQSERSPFDDRRNLSTTVSLTGNTPVINELMADNESTLSDPSGEFDDWVELYNPGTSAIDLQGYYLTDDFSNPGQWALPDISLEAGAFLLIWADGDSLQGDVHTNFRLDKDGESLGLYFKSGDNWVAADTLSFGSQQPDLSFGRESDGSFLFKQMQPTPGQSNEETSTSAEEEPGQPESFRLDQNFPNPFNPKTTIPFTLSQSSRVQLDIFDLQGRKVHTLLNSNMNAGSHRIRFDASALSSGVYYYRLNSEEGVRTRSLILLK